MALTEKQKEILAVTRYYNENRRLANQVVVKLYNEFDAETAVRLTGHTLDEVMELVVAVKSKKFANNALKGAKNLDLFAEEAKVVDLLEEPALTHIFDNEVAQRIYDDFINGKALGTKLPSVRNFQETYPDFSRPEVNEALAILREKGLVGYVEGNWRKGYEVK